MTAPLRVVLLTQWYPPEPVQQPVWIVDALRAAGADCHVVTGVPNYPTGRTVKGYRAWRRSEEVMHGIRVVRTPLFPDHGQGIVRRLLNYSSWALSSAFFARRVLGEADVVLVYSSPATAALAAWVANRVHAVPYVLLIQDVWPDTVTQSGMLPPGLQRLVTRALGYFVRASYRSAAAVIVTSPGMRELLVARGVPEQRISLAYNWVSVDSVSDEWTDKSCLRRELGIPNDSFVLLYAGNHGSAQGLADVVDVVRALPVGRDYHLVLVGEGIEKPELQRRAAGARRVHFVDTMDPGPVQAWMRQADALLVSLVDRPLFRVTTPSKLQMCLAVARPVLAVARGDVERIVRDSRSGLAVAPGDRAALESAISAMAGHTSAERAEWGRNGLAYYESMMSPAVGGARVMSVLHSVARPQVEPRPTRQEGARR